MFGGVLSYKYEMWNDTNSGVRTEGVGQKLTQLGDHTHFQIIPFDVWKGPGEF